MPPRLLSPLGTGPEEGIGEENYHDQELKDPKDDIPGPYLGFCSRPDPSEEDEEGKGEEEGIEDRNSPALPRNRVPTPSVFLGTEPEYAGLPFVFAHVIIIQ